MPAAPSSIKAVLLIASLLVAAAVAGVALVFWFVASERQRDLQAWQVRLGIVADSRAAAVQEWIELQFGALRELAQNASLQIYMTELSLAGAAAAADNAEAGYLRNLLIALVERAGFRAPTTAGAVNANVAPAAVAGIALTDIDGNILVASPTMPPITGALRDAVQAAPSGEPGVVDMYEGVSGLPTIGFVVPVYAIHGGQGAGSEIGLLVGVRVVDNSLWDRLQQPGETEQTAETYLVRTNPPNIEYISPLRDGTAALRKRLALNTPDNAAAFVIDTAGGFADGLLDYDSAEVLVTSRPLSLVPWTLVRKVDTAEALAESNRRQTMLLSTFLLVIVGVSVTIVAVWRHGTSVRSAEAAERYRISAERFSNIMKFLRHVTDVQPTSVVAVTEDGKFTFANRTAAEGTGVEHEEMLGKTMAQVWGPVRSKYSGGQPRNHRRPRGDPRLQKEGLIHQDLRGRSRQPRDPLPPHPAAPRPRLSAGMPDDPRRHHRVRAAA